WLFGALSACGFAAAIYGMLAGGGFQLTWYGAVLLLAATAISFGGARNRWALSWRAKGKRRKLVTPVGSHDGVRIQMADALRELDRLLRDPAARALQARDLQRESQPETSDGGDRALCPDGNCTGVIGPDGKCKLCGLS